MGGLFGGGGETISSTETRIGAMRYQTSAYGMAIPRIYGKTRVQGNLLWYGDFTATPHTTTSGSGGGGKGGGVPQQSNTTYTYSAAFMFALGEGPFTAIGGVWKDKSYDETELSPRPTGVSNAATESYTVPLSAPYEVVVGGSPGFISDSGVINLSGVGVWVPQYDGDGGVIGGSYAYPSLVPGRDYSVSGGVYVFSSALAGSLVQIGYTYQTILPRIFTAFLGEYPAPAPWSYLSTMHPGQDLGYQGIACVAAANYDLGGSASLSNHTFEVTGALPFSPATGVFDANVRDVVVDYLTNPHCGAGFPPDRLGDYEQFSAWCLANGVLISPAYTEQAPANETIAALARIGNAGIVHSDGVLKIIPYGDAPASGNGVVFTPNLTPEYDLTDDDFLATGEDPVVCERSTPADAFNSVTVEFFDRANQYNIGTVTAADQANIEIFGLRQMPPISMHEICDADVAMRVAQIVLQRVLYIRNIYSFQLGWSKARLEPMDLVTLTDSGLGLERELVRLIEIEEDEDGMLSCRAEEMLIGTASAANYAAPVLGGYTTNYNVSPGDVNAPVLFEPPIGLAGGELQVWAAVSGGPQWGGCDVWVSDDGATYQRVGRVDGPARHGVLSAALPVGVDPDLAGTLSVDLSVSRAQLLSASQAQADALDTLCYVDGEFIAYRTATLSSLHRYDLKYLRRGRYGTAISAHGPGARFVRLDGGIGKFPFAMSRLGKPVYVKFPSFNVYGGGRQNLADVPAYTHVLSGAALKAALDNVRGLVSVFRNGLTLLTWDAVTDPVRSIEYEIRKGVVWRTAQVLGRTPITEFVADGDGVYWVAARSELAYSAEPAALVITGASLTANVIAAFDEEALAWPGALTGRAVIAGSDIRLVGAGNFGAIPLLSEVGSVVYFGGVAAFGCYTIPEAHEVDIGVAQPCSVSVSYRMRSDNPFALFSAVPRVSLLPSVAGNYAGLADVRIQIAVAPDSGIYGDWQDFVSGQYVGRCFKLRAVLRSFDVSVTPILDAFSFSVDVPDRVEKGTSVPCSPVGLAVSYSRPFQVPPNVQITILSASSGDDAVLTDEGDSGFFVQIFNEGIAVPRNINWLAQGY